MRKGNSETHPKVKEPWRQKVISPCGGVQSSEEEEGSCWQLPADWCYPARVKKKSVLPLLKGSWHYTFIELNSRGCRWHECLTHRFGLADEKLVELLQQGGFSNNLPAHVGVPGLLIGIPGGDWAKLISSPRHPYTLKKKKWNPTILGAEELQSSGHQSPAPEYP